MLWYSVAAMATSLANGLHGFAGFRFALGLGEAGNWPGATKAVSEWFPRRESGWAVALFDSGSSIGGALAPWIVLTIYHTFGSWRPAFLITGTLGFLWLIAFRALYQRPEDHPRLAPEEREYILEHRATPPGLEATDERCSRHCRMERCSACARRGATFCRRPSPIRCGFSSPTGSRYTWSQKASRSRRA